MTSRRSLDTLTLRSPDALISALPYLLGFQPVESAVVVWLGAGRIRLTQRLDLPAEQSAWPAWLAAMWDHAAWRGADELVLVLVTARTDVEQARSLVLERAASSDIAVRDVLRSDGPRWWSLLCQEPSCCPVDGRLLDTGVQAAVAAEFTLLGIAPLPARSDLVGAFAPDHALVADLASPVDRELVACPPVDEREDWRDDRIRMIVDGLLDSVSPRPAAGLLAALVVGLADVRVRDTVLWECAATAPEALDRALDLLALATRSAPAGHVAPVATCAAVVAWLLGDGTRASVALGRALADDPLYSLAQLVAESLRVGLPPSTWREATSGLSRSDCRYGTGAVRRAM
jgi:hypothetical protein